MSAFKPKAVAATELTGTATKPKSKTVQIGAIWANQVKDERSGEAKQVLSIKLGDSKNKNPEYRYSVELTIRDSEGNVVSTQKDGFVNLYKPNENAPESLKYNLTIPRK